jgi:ribosome-associated translation inhibitor RaiA
MNAPVEVHFHGIQRSEAIEQRVREKVAKLEKHFERMTSCRVVLEATQRTALKPKVYCIKIEIGVPRQRPIVVCHERVGSHASEELTMALRDAFETVLRKIEGVASKRGQRSRLERGRRRPNPPPRGPATA